MPKKTVYMFGCSFSVDYEVSWTWPTMLAKKYMVKNFSQEGFSNSHIYLSILENIEQMKRGDTMVVVWSDLFRFYTINAKHKSKMLNTYLRYFHNEKLVKEHYKFYLDQVEILAREHDVQLVVVWSHPSDYGPASVDRFRYEYLHEDESQYIRNFENEIKPALIFYSLNEIKSLNLVNKILINYFSNDPRPNHIQSKETHSLIFKKLVDKIK